MRWWSEAVERVRALLFRARVDAETEEEMRFHLEMEARRRERESGLAPAEARRQAAIVFGGMERQVEEVRDARGFGWLSGLSLDVKLGGRMLVKHRGLTLASVLALTIALALAAGFFEFLNDVVHPRLGLKGADRLVQIQQWDQRRAAAEPRMLHEYERWRRELTTVEQVSALARSDYQLTTAAGRLAYSVRGARVPASGLRLAGVQPLLGRLFVEADETDAGTLPVVIGYRVWQELFGGSRSVLGSSLRVGETPGEVIGVMPEGYSFPVNQQLWLPFRERASAYQRGEGPPLLVIGRLAAGVTLEEAQAELATFAQRTAAEFPDRQARLTVRVRPLAQAFAMNSLVSLLNVPFILFLVVVCANVATLMFARTVSRAGELTVRSALGASRRRLVLQLAAEALVLTSLAAAVGLSFAQWGFRHVMAAFWDVQQESPPFWFDDRISGFTIGYVGLLAVLAALMIGGIPALKATGRRLRQQLVQAGSGGEGMRFGRFSTGVIVAQVALCVAFLPYAVLQARAIMPDLEGGTEFPAGEFLSGRLAVEGDGGVATAGQRAEPEHAAAMAGALAQVKQRFSELPGIAAVTFVSQLPGFNQLEEDLQLEDEPSKVYGARWVGVDPDFFKLMDGRIVAGRDFRPEDFTGDSRVAIVDAAWAADELRGRNPLGLRLRYHLRAEPEAARWYEIIGVVDGLDPALGPGSDVGIFHPLQPGQFASVQVYARTTAPPASLVPEVAAAVPARSLVVSELKPLAEVWRPVQRSNVYWLAGINVISLVILLFALGGIYALMSFTVTQRAREIAIRTALGANPRRIIMAIFSRAALQIGLGVLIGAVLISVAMVRTPGAAALVAAVAGLMVAVGLTGCLLPALRALRIQPVEALKAE